MMVMYYVRDEKERLKLEALCGELSMRTRRLKPADLNERVGTLAGIGEIKASAVQTQDKAPLLFAMPDVIIFSGVADKALDEFMYSYKNAGLAQIGLKAVLTPSNAGWTLYHLLGELEEECVRLEKITGKD